MAYGFLPHFLFLGTVPTTLMLGDCRDYPCAWGLSRPPSCSGTVLTTLVLGTVSTALMLGDCPDYGYSRGFIVFPMLRSGIVPTTLVLGDCPDHYCARGLSRPLSCSGTVPTTLVLGDCPDHSPTIARRPLSSATCDLYSHTVERHLFFLT